MHSSIVPLLAAAVWMDMGTGKISNRLIALGGVFGLLYRILVDGSLGSILFLRNISIPVILCILLFQMRALGAGDIKLLSMTGAFLNLSQIVSVIVCSFLVAAAISLGKMIYHRNLWTRMSYLANYVENCASSGKLLIYERDDGSWDSQIHFSIAILIGYFLCGR